MELNDLVKKVLRYNKNADIGKIEKAYNFAEKEVSAKTRLSGEKWIKHFLVVADLMADLKADDDAIAAALMHGILKTGKVTKKQLTKEFSLEVTDIIEGISDISKLKKDITSKKYDPESLRKVLLAASRDIRIIIIKLCDKLANIRDLDFVEKKEQKRMAQEVIDIYAPLAYRLGFGKIKSELEDLAFKYLEPGAYKDISNMLEKTRKNGEAKLAKVKRGLDVEFRKSKINAEIKFRVKHIYSIYKKILEKSEYAKNFHDVLAIRILTDKVEDCYNTLRIVHSLFRPLPNLLEDYIAMPKPNGYQSIHTTVALDDGSIMEVQIRTKEMHEAAEEGIAAHFNYKGMNKDEEFDRKLSWIKQLVSNKSGTPNIGIEFFSDHVYVFTPKGKMLELPVDSTPIDFAYHIHSDLGSKCIGAKINGKIVNLKTRLSNGDIVEIITSKTRNPNMEWLKFVKTSKARSKIKQELKRLGKPTIQAYSSEIQEKLEVESGLVSVVGIKYPGIRFASCCNPLPGESIIGINTGVNKVTVHKSECSSLKNTAKKIVKCVWKEFKDKEIVFLISAEDRPGLFAEILNSVAAFGLNVTGAKGKTIGNNQAECSFKVKILDINQLNQLISRIKKIKNVKNINLANNI